MSTESDYDRVTLRERLALAGAALGYRMVLAVCWLRGHDWGEWDRMQSSAMVWDCRFCNRCGKIVERDAPLNQPEAS